MTDNKAYLLRFLTTAKKINEKVKTTIPSKIETKINIRKLISVLLESILNDSLAHTSIKEAKIMVKMNKYSLSSDLARTQGEGEEGVEGKSNVTPVVDENARDLPVGNGDALLPSSVTERKKNYKELQNLLKDRYDEYAFFANLYNQTYKEIASDYYPKSDWKSIKTDYENKINLYLGITESSNETEGGKKSKKLPKKEILGKMRCIYKIPGDRKEYLKHKGKLITVKEYKELMKAKPKKKEAKPKKKEVKPKKVKKTKSKK
tara:strand:+ start:629 stop:1414 length:786 start_codon:yes stop_codon:yes gene_type:complete